MNLKRLRSSDDYNLTEKKITSKKSATLKQFPWRFTAFCPNNFLGYRRRKKEIKFLESCPSLRSLRHLIKIVSTDYVNLPLKETVF